MQTAAAYLWIGQCRKQLARQPHSSIRSSNCSTVSNVFRQKNVTDMTRTLFLYRILACVSSLIVLLCSTLPQLVLAVASPPKEGNIDQLWGWCHIFVYMDHATRSFSTYLIVVPYILFFWDFIFSEVVPRRQLVMKHIFRGILFTAPPIALLSSVAAVPLVIYRYERTDNETLNGCSSSISGATNFLVFDFAVTRVAPMIIIIFVTSGFLIWLPRHHYGVFYEPLIFLFLMAPVVFIEGTIYIACYMGSVRYLFTEQFANALLIFYAFYHMSFSSTFVLATLRSVVTEIRQERKARKRFLLGEAFKEDERKNARRSEVMLGLQRQFSVVFRWRSEYAEDELHLEDRIADKKPERDPEAPPILEESFDDELTEKKPDEVTLHYSILQRSATIKKATSPNTSTPLPSKLKELSDSSIKNLGGNTSDVQRKFLNSPDSPTHITPRRSGTGMVRSPTSVSRGFENRGHGVGRRTESLRNFHSTDEAVMANYSSPRIPPRTPRFE
ncbi:hypothetical protein Aperf_G00000030983 [Anoplocephala perfoliata]